MSYQQPLVTFSNANQARGSWKEVGRTTFSTNMNTVTVSSIPDREYYQILWSTDGATAGVNSNIRFNGDTATNYSRRWSGEGGADNANATINAGVTEVNGLAVPIISVGFMRNIATLEKLHYWFSTGQNAAGAANVPRRSNGANKWDNASVVVDQIATLTGGATNWTGGELLILGWDENQTHTPDENFWQLLASETLTGTDSNVQMTVAAKRYLWAQAYIKPTAALIPWLRFNNVSTGTPYANRQGDDGTETTTASQNQMAIGTSESTPQFVNMFILNVSALEKLVVAHSVSQQTAGEANTPSRRMMATKHALTGSQITEVDFVSSTSSFASGSVFKVWGAD